MEQGSRKETTVNDAKGISGELRQMIHGVLEEFVSQERFKDDPVHKAELFEERRRRESLERRVNELVEENQRARRMAEESERNAAIQAELQKLGVAKVDLAFRVVKDDIVRGPDGGLAAKTPAGEVGLREYLTSWVHENPEFLPARIPGGSGVTSSQRGSQAGYGVELERIRPGMSPEELERVREQISQVALQSLRGE